MSPTYTYYNNSYKFDISQITPTQSSPYDSLYYSNINYSIHGDYTFRRKYETNKQILIRQRSAFKSFYKIPKYIITKTPNDFVAEYKEVSERENKFKGVNLNLII